VLLMLKKPNILIYRDILLQFSETFIRSQAESLQRHTPYYTGSKLLLDLSLPEERTIVINKGRSPAKFAELYSKFIRFPSEYVHRLHQLNPVLIHSHFGQNGVIANSIANILRIPLIVTYHGYDITVKDRFIHPSADQLMYLGRRSVLKREARLFIAVSEFIKRKLIEQNFAPEKILRHYIGVDLKLFKSDSTVVRERIVLFVGRLVEKKGCEYLVKAMARVQKEIPEVKLIVIGSGTLRFLLEELARKTLRNYQFLGAQSSENIRGWMQRAQVFCVPSITAKSGDAEGFGIVFAEAQAMGLPVVSFLSGGIPEAVAHGESGFLVPERDVDELTIHILHLLRNHELWNSFSKKGRERVCELFNLDHQTHILERMYEEIVLENSSSNL
jgi:colanic acid/amylovoran biosynthesis glycosyltransferase